MALGDWISVVFLLTSFIILIVTGSIAASAASDIDKDLRSDPKLDSAHTLLRTGANVGLGIGVTGLVVVILVLLTLGWIPFLLDFMSAIPGKPYFKIFYGVVTTILGFMAGIQAAIAVSEIKSSDTFNDPNISDKDKTALDSAINSGQTAAGLFLGITSLIVLIFVLMAIYDYYKEYRKEKVEFNKEKFRLESEMERDRLLYESNIRREESRIKALEEKERKEIEIQNSILDQVLEKIKTGEINPQNAAEVTTKIQEMANIEVLSTPFQENIPTLTETSPQTARSKLVNNLKFALTLDELDTLTQLTSRETIQMLTEEGINEQTLGILRNEGLTRQIIEKVQNTVVETFPELSSRNFEIAKELAKEIIPESAYIDIKKMIRPSSVKKIAEEGLTVEVINDLLQEGISAETITDLGNNMLKVSGRTLTEQGMKIEQLKRLKEVLPQSAVDDIEHMVSVDTAKKINKDGLTQDNIAKLLKSGISNETISDLTDLFRTI